jgi:hypothetical protein
VKARRPASFRDADGNLIAEFAEHLSNAQFTSKGEEVTGGPFDIDALIDAYPFRSYRLRRVPGTIGVICIAPPDNPVLTPFVCQRLLAEWEHGFGILLLATDATARKRTRDSIDRLLLRVGPGNMVPPSPDRITMRPAKRWNAGDRSPPAAKAIEDHDRAGDARPKRGIDPRISS